MSQSLENGLAALKRAAKNKFRLFSNKTNKSVSAGWRISNSKGVVDIQHTPKFQLESTEVIYTVGSCFAREVEEALEAGNANLALKDIKVPWELYDQNHSRLPHKVQPGQVQARNRSFMNRYSTHSIHHDFKRYFQTKTSHPTEFIPLPNGSYLDLQIKNLQIGDLEHTIKMRNFLDQAIAQIEHSNVLIMTLGMTETWLDCDKNMAIANPPSPDLLRMFPNRFAYFNANWQEVMDELTSIRTLIRNHNPNMKFIVTVSPVPFGNTFESEDAVMAHNYSKSTLVSAARQFSRSFEDVDYFPSYEMITFSRDASIWDADQVHIMSHTVQQVMNKFLSLYLKPAAV